MQLSHIGISTRLICVQLMLFKKVRDLIWSADAARDKLLAS